MYFKMLEKNQVIRTHYNNEPIEVIILATINETIGYSEVAEWVDTTYLVSDGKFLYTLLEYNYTTRDDFTEELTTTTTTVITKKLTSLEDLNFKCYSLK